ncbi:glycosyltransferase family 4 protein [Mycobacterium sp. CVI_P3]|uniref:Glycosyltransferase family 4 protein n=1 Tax=Mycobacterium pinniadriaticum TaxID=2994102 RepID=A0ABT3SAS3_9MYCO|nr:glycosyltransferase family 4 protein [Mycobacterium pinniadriaticum]MCX2930336.1 glycosyltransferase family 4 protein [Mycobacterium pinniadriaticum]MCX2936602.1 glycosyltransferase family 4 protein [Mycobacterium pinniadriaticum]
MSNDDDRPPNPTRVLMVLDSFSAGGAETLTAELVRCAPDTMEVSVASLAPAERSSVDVVERLTQVGPRPTYLDVRRLRDVAGFVRLVRKFRSAPVDVIHAHLTTSAILVSLAAWLARKPVVATLHVNPQTNAGRGDWIKERLATWLPAALGRLVTVSQYAHDRYAQSHGPVGSTWRVIHNGVDLNQYQAHRSTRRGRGPVWATVAALRPNKNHVELVRAWADVVAVHPDATLLVVGDGPSRGGVERAVADAGLGDSVQFLGFRNDVADILGTVDGVVTASVEEALPTALIEAGACGLPVVAADAGGTREIVVDRLTGRLVPLHDVPALSAALLETIGEPALAAEYGAAGRARIEEKFSMDTWIEQLQLLYQEVIEDQSRDWWVRSPHDRTARRADCVA